MAMAIACSGFHNSGILLNPQDIAPLHGGQVYGEVKGLMTSPFIAELIQFILSPPLA